MKKRVMVFGAGGTGQSYMKTLKDAGAKVSCYLTRRNGHYGPQFVGRTWDDNYFPSPLPLIKKWKPDIIIPKSIDWHQKSWASEINTPIFCPTGEALKIERDRDYARKLCKKYGVRVPTTYVVKNRIDAEEVLQKDSKPFVLKNPLCSTTSPIQAIVCESNEDTHGWLSQIDFAEGAYLQEYLQGEEIGHFAFIRDGEIKSIATNWEYKRAFTGDMGPIAGAPLGGLAEQDPDDKYGLAKELIHPLKNWFKKTGFCGPLQVSAIKKDGKYHVIEYNTRLGVTTGAIILRMLNNPVEVLSAVSENKDYVIEWNEAKKFGCSLTLAGHGYPYVVPVPKLLITVTSPVTCDLWWNEVDSDEGKLFLSSHKYSGESHRIADIVALGKNKEEAVKLAYENIKKIKCSYSYYRMDIGRTTTPC